MKKIFYSFLDYNITSSRLYLYLYNTKLNKFMKQKPPCKDCLKEVMCINILDKTFYKQLTSGYKNATIQIKSCEDLRRFVIKNRKFERN
jgi:hypothetical protein